MQHYSSHFSSSFHGPFQLSGTVSYESLTCLVVYETVARRDIHVYGRVHQTLDSPTPAASPAAWRRDTTTALIVVLRLLQSKNVCLRETRNRHIQRIFSHLLALKPKFRLFEGCWQKATFHQITLVGILIGKQVNYQGVVVGVCQKLSDPWKKLGVERETDHRCVLVSGAGDWACHFQYAFICLCRCAVYVLGHWSDTCLPRPAVYKGSRTRLQLFSTHMNQ